MHEIRGNVVNPVPGSAENFVVETLSKAGAHFQRYDFLLLCKTNRWQESGQPKLVLECDSRPLNVFAAPSSSHGS